MSFLIYLICSLMLFSQQVCCAPNYQFSKDESPTAWKKCPDYKVVCPCGTKGEQRVSVLVKMCYNVDTITGTTGCIPCNNHLIPIDMCKNYEKCETCSTDSCLTCPEGKAGEFCFDFTQDNRIAPDMELNAKYPINVRIPRGKPFPHNRVARSKDGCDFPNQMETAELACILYDYQVTCNATCAWGYKVQGQTTVYYECKYYNKFWTPHKTFQECTPIVNCEVELVSNGKLACTSLQMNEPDVCDISCSTYDEEEGGDIPERSYKCSLSGQFDPPLPYCAQKNGTGSMMSNEIY